MSFFSPRQPGVFLEAIVAVLGGNFSGDQLEILVFRHTIQVPFSHVSFDTVKTWLRARKKITIACDDQPLMLAPWHNTVLVW